MHLVFSFLIYITFLIPQNTYSDDTLFKKSLRNFSKGNHYEFKKIKSQIKSNYILYPYLELWEFKATIQKAKASDFEVLFNKYKNTIVEEQLLKSWVHELFKRKQYRKLVGLFQSNPLVDDKSICFYGLSQKKLDLPINKTKFLNVWLNPNSIDNTCTPLFKYFFSKKIFDKNDIASRLRLAFNSRNKNNAKFIFDYSQNSKKYKSLYYSARKNKYKFARKFKLHNDPIAFEIFLFAIKSKKYKRHHLDLEKNNFSKENLAYINYIFSIKEQKNNLVTDDFNHLSSKQLSVVFSKIISSSNQEVLNFIDNYENKKKKLTSKLSYWKKSLAPKLSSYIDKDYFTNSSKYYYYFLLDHNLNSNFLELNETKNTIKKFVGSNLPLGIDRALHLKKINLNYMASREWDFEILKLSDDQILDAANRANNINWFIKSIAAAQKIPTDNNIEILNILYPMPYRETIAKYSKKFKVPESLIYAVIRQESRFNQKARSPANAKGLMQIIPSTGRWILRQLNYKSRTIKKIYNPNINVMMGTFYIKHLSKKLDNLIFTLASYNAGVRNVSKWSKKYSTKIPEKFIEQIPFYETRNYVKKVLSNYIVYEYIINGKVINYSTLSKKL